jgi:hypothetical protein
MIGQWISFNGPRSGQRYLLESIHGDTLTATVGAGRGREVVTRKVWEACYPRTAKLSISPQTRKATR